MLKLDEEKHSEFRDDVNGVDWLRGLWFEDYKSTEQFANTQEFLKHHLKEFAEKWGFYYVED